MMYKITLILLILNLSACATVVKFDDVSYNTNKTYPPIFVLVNDGHVDTVQSCGVAGCYTFPEKRHYYIFQSLKKSGRFEAVHENQLGGNYQLFITFEQRLTDPPSLQFAKLMLSAITLFLIPIPVEVEYIAEFTLVEQDRVLADFQYSETKQALQWILQSPNINLEVASDFFVSRFISDLDKSQKL